MEKVTEPKVLTFKEQSVLDQLRQNHKQTVSDFESLDNKASIILSTSSIVITIITGVQLISGISLRTSNLLIILLLFGATLVFIFKALFPTDIAYEPIKADWNKIREALEDEDNEFYYRLLSGYEYSILRNMEINTAKAKMIRFSFVTLSATTILSLLSAAKVL